LHSSMHPHLLEEQIPPSSLHLPHTPRACRGSAFSRLKGLLQISRNSFLSLEPWMKAKVSTM
jgi:hypothetical protein